MSPQDDLATDAWRLMSELVLALAATSGRANASARRTAAELNPEALAV